MIGHDFQMWHQRKLLVREKFENCSLEIWNIQFVLILLSLVTKEIIWGESKILRVAKIQDILFFKSTAERVGSDIKRFWIWIFNRFGSI